MTTTNLTIRPRLLAVASVAFFLAIPIAACTSDNNNASEVSSAVSDAVADVSSAADSAAADASDAIDSVANDNADEGTAKDLANQVKAKLETMSSPGEPLVTNITEAAAEIVKAPNEVTGLDDSDNDGKDDDAKFTIEANNGDDKACVQSQNAVWEVTDDEC
jgi:uncharacterized phage infection (PIP) family protein YhgE